MWISEHDVVFNLFKLWSNFSAFIMVFPVMTLSLWVSIKVKQITSHFYWLCVGDLCHFSNFWASVNDLLLSLYWLWAGRNCSFFNLKQLIHFFTLEKRALHFFNPLSISIKIKKVKHAIRYDMFWVTSHMKTVTVNKFSRNGHFD